MMLSMGMDRGQLYRMTAVESVYYGIYMLLYIVVGSFVIDFVVFSAYKLLDDRYYFTYPWSEMAFALIIVVVITPLSLFVASFIGLPPMNFVDAKVEQNRLVAKHFALPLTDAEQKTLRPYLGKEIVLGFRPENTSVGNHFEMKVLSNENLGMNTLVHGHIGRDGSGERITCKLNGWCQYKAGDVVSISITKKHFFDKETTQAIRMEEEA